MFQKPSNKRDMRFVAKRRTRTAKTRDELFVTENVVRDCRPSELQQVSRRLPSGCVYENSQLYLGPSWISQRIDGIFRVVAGAEVLATLFSFRSDDGDRVHFWLTDAELDAHPVDLGRILLRHGVRLSTDEDSVAVLQDVLKRAVRRMRFADYARLLEEGVFAGRGAPALTLARAFDRHSTRKHETMLAAPDAVVARDDNQGECAPGVRDTVSCEQEEVR